LYKKKKILLVVLARSGSVGIKNKNIRKIKNVPLVGRVGNIANKIKFFDKKIVSTDSTKIGKIAFKYGLEFNFLRPKKISGPKISDLEVLKHALKRSDKKNNKFDIVVSMPPTSPLRKINDVKNCIRKIIDKKLDAVWTISKTDTKYHPLKALVVSKKRLKYYSKYGNKIKYRQQLKNTYFRNGACYAFSRKTILENSILPKKSGYVISLSDQISIDTYSDLILAKKILKN
tara:strand:- start:224 stop:916 length:693 start_codon:yes stop_codon:yes gene_type:complete